MRNLLFIALTLSSLSMASTENNGPLDDAFKRSLDQKRQTHYEALGKRFKNGRRPNLNLISNIAWSGRCFDRDNQNVPTNAGYIFRQRKVTGDVGPASKRIREYEAFSYWKEGAAPNFYDNQDLTSVLKRIESQKGDLATVTSKGVRISMDDGANKSTLRVSGYYLFEELKKNHMVYSRCYYFKAK